MANAVRLRIDLLDVTPAVTRRLLVPERLRLDRLHAVFQAALGWTDSHLWEMDFGGVSFGVPDPDWPDGPLEARSVTLKAALADSGVRTFRYLYDFGDAWEHRVKVEKIEPAPAGLALPLLIGACGRCPPEHVGGAPGYADFLAAISDPAHEEHQATLAWAGGTFDPEDLDIAALDQAVTRLAQRWAPKPRTKS